MIDRVYFAVTLVLAILFAVCVGGLVNALQLQSERAVQPQQYTVTIRYIPAESKGDGK